MSGIELDDELIEEFVNESREAIEEVEPTLIALEREASSDGEALNRVFRAFHSMKGSAGFLGIEPFVEVTHTAENLLDDVRQGTVSLCAAHVDALCDALDYCRAILEQIEAGSTDYPDPHGVLEVLALVRSLDEAPADSDTAESGPDLVDDDVGDGKGLALFFGPPVVETPDPPAADFVLPDPPPTPPPAAVETPEVSKPTRSPATAAPKRSQPAQRETIRVDVAKLDLLMNLVGELILAENAVAHHELIERLQEAEDLRRATLNLYRVTRSLQDVATSLRMVPVQGTFRRMQRLVRDLSNKQGKQVRLELAGADTEVDKNLIEGIGDPLVHIIRNSIDHGLETAEERLSSGKASEGVLRLSAEHRAGEVWITVQDDGRGLDAEKILARAIERGLLPPDAQPSVRETHELLFEPGFSTAKEVTDVSGRGVGMDVVRRNIERLNGRVDLSSARGEGTTVVLRIPLTLAIIEGMLVRVGDVRYTVPLLAIRESVRVEPGLITRLADGREIARIRGQIVPVLRLSEVHGQRGDDPARNAGIVIAVEHDSRTVGLHVDALIGKRQTVIKALPAYLSHLQGLAGCTILASGEVSLILDIGSLIASAEIARADELAIA